MYIRDHLGEQHLEYSTLIPLSIIYGYVSMKSGCMLNCLAIFRIFLILGVLGNVATCLVIMKNEYMRTTTNIYLFNLAVTDLATLLLTMPSELYLMWKQYPWTFGEVNIFSISHDKLIDNTCSRLLVISKWLSMKL